MFFIVYSSLYRNFKVRSIAIRQPPESPFIKGARGLFVMDNLLHIKKSCCRRQLNLNYLHPVQVVAVQLPQPPELLPEVVSPLPFTDIPNTENIFWMRSPWHEGQNNFFRSEARLKYSSNLALH